MSTIQRAPRREIFIAVIMPWASRVEQAKNIEQHSTELHRLAA